MKAEYISGLIEIEHGWDLNRAKLYFLGYIQIFETQDDWSFRRENPDLVEMNKQSKVYIK